MDSSPINFDDARPLGQAPSRPARTMPNSDHADTIALKWAALHETAGVVRQIAGNEQENKSADSSWLAMDLRQTDGWKRRLIEQGLDDLTVIMELGLSALLGVQAQGADPDHAAKALWEEFQNVRNGLLALMLPVET